MSDGGVNRDLFGVKHDCRVQYVSVLTSWRGNFLPLRATSRLCRRHLSFDGWPFLIKQARIRNYCGLIYFFPLLYPVCDVMLCNIDNRTLMQGLDAWETIAELSGTCTILFTCCARGGSLINLTPLQRVYRSRLPSRNYAPAMELCVCLCTALMDEPLRVKTTFGKHNPDEISGIDPNLLILLVIIMHHIFRRMSVLFIQPPLKITVPTVTAPTLLENCAHLRRRRFICHL